MDLIAAAISSPERHKNPGHGFLSRLENGIILGGFSNTVNLKATLTFATAETCFYKPGTFLQ